MICFSECLASTGNAFVRAPLGRIGAAIFSGNDSHESGLSAGMLYLGKNSGLRVMAHLAAPGLSSNMQIARPSTHPKPNCSHPLVSSVGVWDSEYLDGSHPPARRAVDAVGFPQLGALKLVFFRY